MEKLIEFATKNYLVFTIVSVVLILALIGYFAEKRSKMDVKIRNKNINNTDRAVSMNTVTAETSPQLNSVSQNSIQTNQVLNNQVTNQNDIK